MIQATMAGREYSLYQDKIANEFENENVISQFVGFI